MMYYFRRSKFLTSLWLVLYLSINLFYTPTLAGELEVDTSAPISQQPTIEKATNGIPIVNITEPSPGGVSRNTFTQYNVAEPGIILNNNPNIQPKELNANKSYLTNEPLFANENLKGRAAEVILTEVTGIHTSKLLGPTEIYGHSADFILANPNGIYCNGANFVNANRVTLTTGQPKFDAERMLRQLSVSKGTIQVVGNGVQINELPDTKVPTSPLEILSKVIEINGALQNKQGDVYLYGGEQDFTYQHKQFTLQPSAQTKIANKYVAVDANLLGNIQANKIYIIATQQGVGVNSPKLTATGEIEITASGDIKLKEVHTNKDLHVTSKDGNIQQEGTKTVVAHDYHLEAEEGNITLHTPHLQIGEKGQLTSRQLAITPITNLWAEGTAKDHPTITLQVSDKFSNQGNINITQLVASPLQELTNTGKLITQESLKLVGQQIHHSGEIVARKGDIQLTGHQQITNQGLILSQQGKLDLQGEIIHNTGKLSTKEQLTLSATALEQHGTIEGKGVKVTIQGILNNSKDIYSQEELAITSGPLHNTGELKAGKQLALTTSNLEQEGLITGKDVKLSVQGALKNSKDIASQGKLAITSGQFHNLGKVISADHLILNSRSLHNQGILHTLQGDIILQVQDTLTNTKKISSKTGHVTLKAPVRLTNQGKVIAHQNLILKAGDLENNKIIRAITGAATIKLTQKFTNQQAATIASAQNMTLQAPEAINQGSITSQDTLDLSVSNLHNPGTIQAASWKSGPFQQVTNGGILAITHDIDLVTDKLTNTGILFNQQGKMNLQVNQDLVNDKEITSQGAQTIQVTGKFTNQGTILTKKEQAITANQLNNTGTILSQEGSSTLQITKQLDNAGKIRSHQGQEIQATTLNNWGEIASEVGSLTITLKQDLHNQATLHTPTDLIIQAKSLTNTHRIYTGGIGKITLAAQLTNHSAITGRQGLEIQAAEVTNSGEMQSQEGHITLVAHQQLTNNSLIISQKDLTLQAPILSNQANGKIITSKTGNINLKAKDHLSNQGTVMAHQDLRVEASEVENHKTMQATRGKATIKLTQKLTNQPTAKIASAKEMILQASEVVNQGNIISKATLDLVVSKLNNSETIQAAHWKSTPFQQVINSGKLEVKHDINLTTDQLTNTGKIGNEVGELKIKVNQDLINAKDMLSKQTINLEVTGKLTNSGKIQGDKEQTIIADELENNKQISSPGLLTITTKQHTRNTGSIQGGEGVALRSGTLTNTSIGLIKSDADNHITTQGVLENHGKIESKQDIKLASEAGTIDNAGTIHAEGDAKLKAQGDIINSGTLVGQKLTVKSTFGQFTNSGTVQPIDELTIQAHTLHNTGQIKATGATTLTLQDKLHNKNKITSGGNLTINQENSSLELLNEGTLASGSTLDVHARTLTNQGEGNLQAKMGKLVVTDSLVNTKGIQAAETLTITAGKLTNSGEIGANQVLDITILQGDVDNGGKLLSKEDNIILILNKGTLTNSGTILGVGGASVTTTIGSLTNSGLMGSWDNLTLSVAKKLDNQKKGTISTIEGSVTITAQDIHNSGAINPGKGASTITAKNGGGFYHYGTIQARGELTIQSDKLIENRGVILAEQDLLLQAPIIQHYNKLQSNYGDLTLNADQQIENSGKLVSFKKLVLQTARLVNQADLGSDKDLTLHIPEIENTKQISARGKLDLHVMTFTNRGEILGGQGNNLIEVSKLLTNYNKIATSGPLTIQVPQTDQNSSATINKGELEIVNHGELMANQTLRLDAKKLANYKKLQGGGKSYLAIDSILNAGMIASVEDLEIHAEKISRDEPLASNRQGWISRPNFNFYSGSALPSNGYSSHSTTGQRAWNFGQQVTNYTPVPQPSIQSNKDLTIEVGKLSAHDIHGGDGNTNITIKQEERIEQKNEISSKGNLTINLLAGQRLYNYNKIIAVKDLIIQGGEKVSNKEDACIVSSSQNLIIRCSDKVTNNEDCKLQAANNLAIIASDLYNYQGAILSGKDLHVQVKEFDNDKGEVFAGGNITLEGRDNGYAEKITNDTGSKEARIEAIGDITIKAKKLRNEGAVIDYSYDIRTRSVKNHVGPYAESSWEEVDTTYGKYMFNSNERDGDLDFSFYETKTKTPISKVRTRLAHINANSNLTLVGVEEINNYGGKLTAGNKLSISSNHETSSSSSCQAPVSKGDSIINGTKVQNITPSTPVTISDAHTYEKRWRRTVMWKTYHLYRVYHNSETFTIHSKEEATIRGGSGLYIDSKNLDNGIKVPEGKVAPCADPLDKLEGNGLLKLDDLKLPEGENGLFTVQVDTTISLDNNQAAIPQIQANPLELPSLAQSGFEKVDIQVDQELAKALAPPHYRAVEIEQAIAPYTPPITTEQLAELPVSSTDTNFQAIHQEQPIAEESDTSYDLPTGTVHQAEKRELASDHITYQPAPPIEEVKFTCLPPLVRSSVPVDQSKFYGSPYFLRHVGLDPGQRGTPANPLRFLGDPFYESRIISDAIQKATARQLLYEDVATPEEQIKVLIDNTAAIAKDLKVGLGVALSKDQINKLKKDILWYEEKTVKGQQVLVPQVYLTKETISNLRSKPTGGIGSGGKMTLNVQEKLTNTGTISAKDEVTIRAQSLHNESFGNTQATIQSTKGAVDLVTKKNIDNLSGKIVGVTATKVISQEGAIHNTTKLLSESTLGMQASIESGGNLTLQAQEDIINKAAKIKATGNATLQSETGDVKFLTQVVKTTATTQDSSHENGFFSSSHSSSTTTHTKTEHAVSELEIGRNATIKGRDITFMGTKAQVGQDMNLDASRDINALAVQDIEETTKTSVEHKEERGLFTSKSTTKAHSSTHRESASKGIDFKVGGTLGAKAGGNADFEGANVTAKSVRMAVEGETTIRNAYDETTHEEGSSVDNKDEVLFGLFKDNNRKKNHSKVFDKKATGNSWKVEDSFEVIGKGDVTTQGIELDAHQFKIESTKGNVYDKAAEEVHEEEKEVDEYSLRQGLLTGKKDDLQWKGEEGRASIKLREKKEKKTQTKEEKHTGKSSSFKTHAKIVKTADGKEELIQGNGTFKGAKKVVLEATETDIQGKLSLQGKEGVSILAKKEIEKKEEHQETYTEELSLGIKNSIVAAASQGKAVLDALKAEEEAIRNYSNYKDQLQEAKKLYENGIITQEDYQAVQEEEKFHLMATAAATLAVGSKTKQFLSSTASAIKTAGATAGFSLDLQADIRKTVDQVISLSEKAKGSKIKTQQLEITTEGTFQVEGSQIDALASTIQAKKMEVKTFVGKHSSESSGNSRGLNVTVGMDVLPSLDVSLDGESREGKSGGVQHTHSLLNLGHTTLKVEEDVKIKGGQIKTKTVAGKVGGDIYVETVLDTNQGEYTRKGGSISFGIKPGLVKASGGINGSYGKQDSKLAAMQSGFTSEEEFKLAVGGKSHLKGSVIGSEKVGKTDLQTQELIQEDVDTYQRNYDWGVSVSGNVSQTSGASETSKGGKADIYYNRNNARQKLKSNVGGGSKVPIDYLNTKSQVKVDSQMAKLAYDLAIDPGKVGKELRDDFLTVGLGGRAVMAGIVNVGETGVVGAIEAIQRGLAATGGVIELTKRENEQGGLAKAEGAEEFEKNMNEEGDQLQQQMGVKDRAKVKLYQGDSTELQGIGHDENNASFDEKGNTINYNTSRKDFKKVETIADDLSHESTHKAISETKFAKKLVNNDQEEAVAKIVGKQARSVANMFKDRNSSKLTTAATNHVEWNKRNREALKASNEKLAKVKEEDVKASGMEMLADLGVGDIDQAQASMEWQREQLEEGIKQMVEVGKELGKNVDQALEESGVKEKAQEIGNKLEELITDNVEYTSGVINALGNDMFELPLQKPLSLPYYRGQRDGHKTAILISGVEGGAGGFLLEQSINATIVGAAPTGGTITLVTVPTAALGGGFIAHAAITAKRAKDNLDSYNYSFSPWKKDLGSNSNKKEVQTGKAESAKQTPNIDPKGSGKRKKSSGRETARSNQGKSQKSQGKGKQGDHGKQQVSSKDNAKQPKGEPTSNSNNIGPAASEEKSHVFGEKGMKTESKTIWQQKGSKARIDIENPKPGERTGQIHYHDAKDTKYMYDPATDKFYAFNLETKTYDIEAPRKINKLLSNKTFRKDIEKALRYLGEIE